MSHTSDSGDISAFEFEIIKTVFRKLHACTPFDELTARREIINLTAELADGKQPSDQFVDAVLNACKAEYLPPANATVSNLAAENATSDRTGQSN